MWTSWRKAQSRYQPRRAALEGNHEYRLTRALDLQPELSGWMSFDDFGLDRYYTDVVRFEGSVPSTISIGGIVFAHFMTAGNFCRPIPGITRPRS